jgi:hypothetical protein
MNCCVIGQFLLTQIIDSKIDKNAGCLDSRHVIFYTHDSAAEQRLLLLGCCCVFVLLFAAVVVEFCCSNLLTSQSLTSQPLVDAAPQKDTTRGERACGCCDRFHQSARESTSVIHSVRVDLII